MDVFLITLFCADHILLPCIAQSYFEMYLLVIVCQYRRM